MFEPQPAAKHQRRPTGFDARILALYAKEMRPCDILKLVKALYGVAVPPTPVS